MISDRQLAEMTVPFIERIVGAAMRPAQVDKLTEAMPVLRPRARTLVELADNSLWLFWPPCGAQSTDPSKGLIYQTVGLDWAQFEVCW